jgi:hypothetical protein
MNRENRRQLVILLVTRPAENQPGYKTVLWALCFGLWALCFELCVLSFVLWALSFGLCALCFVSAFEMCGSLLGV